MNGREELLLRSTGLRGVPRRFVLRLVHGDLVKRRAECFVVNHYPGLRVSGAARAVDQYTGGMLSAMAARGVFNGPPGAVYFVPAILTPLATNIIAVLSLGEYERFLRPDVGVPGAVQFIQERLRQIGHSLAVACAEVKLRDVASTLHGTGESAQIDPALAMQYFLAGYWQGLKESGEPGQTYWLTLVEIDGSKLEGVRAGIAAAIEAGQCGDLQPVGEMAGPQAGDGLIPWAWMGNLDTIQEPRRRFLPRHLRLGALLEGSGQFKLSIIGTGSADQVVFDRYPRPAIDDARQLLAETRQQASAALQQIAQAESAGGNGERAALLAGKRAKVDADVRERVTALGRTLYNQLFNPDVAAGIRQRLATKDAQILLLRLDENTAGIPWELLDDGTGLFALTRRMGRQLELVGQVRQPPSRPVDSRGRLRVLLVANPTGDLPAIEEESRRILSALYALPGVEIQVKAFFGAEVRRRYVMAALNERYDVFHFAGHAYYHPQMPAESGLVLAGGDVLTADMMWSLAEPPALVFFNGCETAATPADRVAGGGRLSSELPLGSISALLRAGTRNFVGTQWPVEDVAAAEVAIACYAELARGESVGEALRRARLRTIEALGFAHLSWASYVLYGSPWNRLLEEDVY